MFQSFPNTLQHRLQYALAITALVAGLAALVTLTLIGMALLLVGLKYGDPFALYLPNQQIASMLMPQGPLGGAVWMMLLMSISGILVGVTAFVILFFGRADAI